ncbi:hypothetical protein V8C26DRAFT_382959 [Trichoderma gracile]
MTYRGPSNIDGYKDPVTSWDMVKDMEYRQRGLPTYYLPGGRSFSVRDLARGRRWQELLVATSSTDKSYPKPKSIIGPLTTVALFPDLFPKTPMRPLGMSQKPTGFPWRAMIRKSLTSVRGSPCAWLELGSSEPQLLLSAKSHLTESQTTIFAGWLADLATTTIQYYSGDDLYMDGVLTRLCPELGHPASHVLTKTLTQESLICWKCLKHPALQGTI